MRQYQIEERSLVAGRLRVEQARIGDLMGAMRQDTIAPPANVEQLRAALNRHYRTERFDECRTMGDLVWRNLELMQAH